MRFIHVVIVLAIAGTVVTALHLGGASLPPAAVQTEQPADAPSGPPPPQGVLLIQADDVSGSVRRALEPFAERMASQYTEGLQPGDAFARIVFADQAKLVDLREIRSDEDRLDLTKLSVVPPAPGRWTYFSQALSLALQLGQERRRDRAVVFLMFTDGLLDTRPADADRERKAIAEAASAWRQTHAQIMIVGVAAGERSENGLEELATLLGARRVSIDDLVRERLITRSVVDVREPEPPQTTPAPPAAPVSSWMMAAVSEIRRRLPIVPVAPWVIPAALAMLVVLVGTRVFRSRRSRSATMPNPRLANTVAPPAIDLHTTLTTPSGTKRFCAHLPEDRGEWRVRFGRELVNLPGLPAGALALAFHAGELQLQVASGVPIKVNRQPVPPEGIALPIGVRTNLEWATNAAVLDVHQRALTPSSLLTGKAVQ